MKLHKVTCEEFCKFITSTDGDQFAKTFVAKAKMQDLWDQCMGLWDGDDLMGAIIVSYSKRNPKIANLQLLHTFVKHRKKGVAAKLCQWVFNDAMANQAKYLRVSAESDAVAFYEKVGFQMLGEQKSGSQLSMCRLSGSSFADCDYDIGDPEIFKAVYKKGKGGCVKVFKEIEVPELFAKLCEE